MSRSRSRSRSKPRERDVGPEVEAFLRAEPEIEERAATMLRSKPPEVQRLVLTRGGLTGTRNPTAVLVSRIRNAEEGLRPVLETERAPEEIERFLIIERVEPHAAARLRRAARIVQTAVVARGSLAGTRDPTAVLMTRIRDAEKEHAPSTDPATAAQAAIANGETVDPYGSDPQAYAMAYYAQMQAAYPQAVQAADGSCAGVSGYPGMQMASYPGVSTVASSEGGQMVHVAGTNGAYQSIQLPPGYQLYPVGVANPDGTIGALPASMAGVASSAVAAITACGEAATQPAATQVAATPPAPTAATMQSMMQIPMSVPSSYPCATYPSMPPMASMMGYPQMSPMGYPQMSPMASMMGYSQQAAGMLAGYPGYPGMAALQAMQMVPGTAAYPMVAPPPPPAPPPALSNGEP